MNNFGGFFRLWFYFAFVLANFSLHAKTSVDIEAMLVGIHPGDLIFFNMNTGMSTRAVIESTKEQLGSSIEISHVGILDISQDGEVILIEASPKAGVVRRIPLLQFLQSPLVNIQNIMIGRWKPEWRLAAFNAVIDSQEFIGKSFEPKFDWNSPHFYCSKLIYRLYKDPKNLDALFLPSLMTFGSAGSEARAFWEQYFKSMKLPVPEGQPGINPLGIYLQGLQKYFVLP